MFSFPITSQDAFNQALQVAFSTLGESLVSPYTYVPPTVEVVTITDDTYTLQDNPNLFYITFSSNPQVLNLNAGLYAFQPGQVINILNRSAAAVNIVGNDIQLAQEYPVNQLEAITNGSLMQIMNMGPDSWLALRGGFIESSS